ncbi:MAG TPA: cupredoxin domain-containing protein [Alphaproteobacteria bacterium]|jgi:plastocyanin|nr:cupredoxin domain-containing protein [Alphaproteobacteria bacterium]
MPTLRILALAVVALPLFLSPAAAEDVEATLTIKDHKFDPVELVVPAGQRIKLTVKNLDSTPEEFESHELRREKVIPGGAEAVIYIGPLKAGTYKYFGEFHEDTAQGRIVAK